MGTINLYKRFYSASLLSGSTYNLIDPTSITATTFNSSNVIVESNKTITRESLGIYYIQIDSANYTNNQIYNAMFYVDYIPGAPTKQLPTNFSVNIPSVNPSGITVVTEFLIATNLDYNINKVNVLNYNINK